MSTGWRSEVDAMSEGLREFLEDVETYFQRLSENAERLSAEDLAFVLSVRAYYDKYDTLSVKQVFRLRCICTEAGVL